MISMSSKFKRLKKYMNIFNAMKPIILNVYITKWLGSNLDTIHVPSDIRNSIKHCCQLKRDM